MQDGLWFIESGRGAALPRTPEDGAAGGAAGTIGTEVTLPRCGGRVVSQDTKPNMAEKMRRSRAVMSLDRPAQLTLPHGLSVDSKVIAPSRTSRRPPQLCAGLMGIAMGSPDDVEIAQRGYKSDGASLDRSHDSLRSHDMSRFESGMSLDRDPVRRRELYNRHRGRTFDEECPQERSPSHSSDPKLRSKIPSTEEAFPEPTKRSVSTSERKKSKTDCESASSLQDTTSNHSSGLFEKHFGRNKKQYKLEKSKRLSTSALYDRSPTEAFYNKTGSMRLSATELFEKFCSEDFSSLYGPGSHYDDVFKDDDHSKNYRRESRSSPHMRATSICKSDKNNERARSTTESNTVSDIIEEMRQENMNSSKPNSLPLSAYETKRKPVYLSLPVHNDSSSMNYNVTDQYEPCLGVIRKKRNSFKKEIMPNFKDRPLFEWCNSEFRPIDDDESPTVSKLTAEPTPEEITLDDSRSFSSDVFASNEDISLHESCNKVSRGRLVHQRGIDKEELTLSTKSNSLTIEEESLSFDKSLKSPDDTWSVTERIEYYAENPRRSVKVEKPSISHLRCGSFEQCSKVDQFLKQKDESADKNTYTVVNAEPNDKNSYFDEKAELEYSAESYEIGDKAFATHIEKLYSKQHFSDSHATFVLFEDDRSSVKDAIYEHTEQDTQSLIDYSSETEEISGFCDINEENMERKNDKASHSIWVAINAFEKIEKYAERAKQLREQMKDPNNSLCSSQEQNEDVNEIQNPDLTKSTSESNKDASHLSTQDDNNKPNSGDAQLSPMIPKIPPRLSMQKLRLINIEGTIAMANENKASSKDCPGNSKDTAHAEASEIIKSKNKEGKKSFFRLQKNKSDDLITVPKKSKCFPL